MFSVLERLIAAFPKIETSFCQVLSRFVMSQKGMPSHSRVSNRAPHNSAAGLFPLCSGEPANSCSLSHPSGSGQVTTCDRTMLPYSVMCFRKRDSTFRHKCCWQGLYVYVVVSSHNMQNCNLSEVFWICCSLYLSLGKTFPYHLQINMQLFLGGNVFWNTFKDPKREIHWISVRS